MNRAPLVVSLLAAISLAACSGGGTAVQPPPPTGPFSLASLSGQYAFVTIGESFTSGSLTATPLARVGTFTADGHGGITTGLEDVNAAGVTTPAVPVANNSSYTLNSDGRGTITLNFATGGSVTFGITLTSTNDGLLVDETSNANQASTGSGNFTKQNAGSFTVSAVAGNYVFDFSGTDGQGLPESLVGEFSANNGVLNPGVTDRNDDGALTNAAINGTLTGDQANGPNFGRGTASIDGQAYVFYIVDNTRVRFLSAGGGSMLAGDAVLQSNIPANVGNFNSGFVFSVAGASATGAFTQLGRFTANGATVSQVIADAQDSGLGKFFATNSVTAGASISSYDATTGRGVVTFRDTNLATPFTFVFYLSSATQGVIQDVSGTNGVAAQVADGSLLAQTPGPFSGTNITGTYAFNWSGLSVQNGGGFKVQDQEDLVAQAKVSSLGLTGAADIFQFQAGAPSLNNVVGGTITIGGNGTGSDGMRSTMAFKLTSTSSATVNFVVYFVNPRFAFFASNNQSTNRIVAGVLKAQQ